MVCGILVLQPGINPVSPASEAWSQPLDHQGSPPEALTFAWAAEVAALSALISWSQVSPHSPVLSASPCPPTWTLLVSWIPECPGCVGTRVWSEPFRECLESMREHFVSEFQNLALSMGVSEQTDLVVLRHKLSSTPVQRQQHTGRVKPGWGVKRTKATSPNSLLWHSQASCMSS